MKKLALFILLILTTTTCCKKDEEEQAVNQIDLLPPATQTGANTAGCLVNGKAFLPGNFVMPLKCDYYQQQYFLLALHRKIDDNIFTIRIEVAEHLEVGHTYKLTLEDYITGQDGNSGVYKKNSDPPPGPHHYGTNETYYGELTITHHDFDNMILSGTFWFDAVNSEGEVVHVTEGRFDCEY